MVEVQAYVYGAKRRAAEIAMRLGHGELAEELSGQAELLRKRFHEAFWSDEIGTTQSPWMGISGPALFKRPTLATHC